MNLLEVKNLHFSYDKKSPLIKGIDFQIPRGESLGIIGPNGAGKSTLLKLMVGLLEYKEGEVQFNGEKISSKNPLSNYNIAYVPQLNKFNYALPTTIQDLMSFSTILKWEAKFSIEETLQLVGLKKPLDSQVENLSGGERQRVLLAKALLTSPELLFLDEPTKGLDSTGQDQLLEVIEKIKKETNASVMIVDHNINQVIKHCEHILCMGHDFHWHDQSEMVDKNILEQTYHCEFEHLLIHQKGIDHLEHRHQACDHHHNAKEHKEDKDHD